MYIQSAVTPSGIGLDAILSCRHFGFGGGEEWRVAKLLASHLVVAGVLMCGCSAACRKAQDKEAVAGCAGPDRGRTTACVWLRRRRKQFCAWRLPRLAGLAIGQDHRGGSFRRNPTQKHHHPRRKLALVKRLGCVICGRD